MPQLFDKVAADGQRAQQQRQRHPKPDQQEPSPDHFKQVFGPFHPANQMEQHPQQHKGHCCAKKFQQQPGNQNVENAHIAVIKQRQIGK